MDQIYGVIVTCQFPQIYNMVIALLYRQNMHWA